MSVPLTGKHSQAEAAAGRLCGEASVAVEKGINEATVWDKKRCVWGGEGAIV